MLAGSRVDQRHCRGKAWAQLQAFEGPGRRQLPLHILVIAAQGRESAGQGQPEVMAPLLMGSIMVQIMHAWEREWGQQHKEMGKRTKNRLIACSWNPIGKNPFNLCLAGAVTYPWSCMTPGWRSNKTLGTQGPTWGCWLNIYSCQKAESQFSEFKTKEGQRQIYIRDGQHFQIWFIAQKWNREASQYRGMD